MIRFQDLQENVRSHEFKTCVQENQTHEIKFQETLDLIKKTPFQDSRFTSCETLIGLSTTQEALIPLLGNHAIKSQEKRIKTFDTQRKNKTKIPQKIDPCVSIKPKEELNLYLEITHGSADHCSVFWR
jgi:hypothetical protein